MKSFAAVAGSVFVCSMLVVPAWGIDINLSAAPARGGVSSFFNPHRLLATMGAPEELKIREEAVVAPRSFVGKVHETLMARETYRETVQQYVSPLPAGLAECISDCSIESHRRQGVKALLDVTE